MLRVRGGSVRCLSTRLPAPYCKVNKELNDRNLDQIKQVIKREIFQPQYYDPEAAKQLDPILQKFIKARQNAQKSGQVEQTTETQQKKKAKKLTLDIQIPKFLASRSPDYILKQKISFPIDPNWKDPTEAAEQEDETDGIAAELTAEKEEQAIAFSDQVEWVEMKMALEKESNQSQFDSVDLVIQSLSEKTEEEPRKKLFFPRPLNKVKVRGSLVHFDEIPYSYRKVKPVSKFKLKELESPENSETSPVTYYHSTLHDYRCVRHILGFNGIQRVDEPETAQLHWGLSDKFAGRHACSPLQKVHHFPGSILLGNKVALGAMIRRKMFEHGRGAYEICPRTFLLPLERKQFIAFAESAPKSRWIYKPATAAGGKGIKIMPYEEAKEFVLRKEFLEGEEPELEPGIISEYIENPLLINGRKFDLRLYVVVTSYDPLRIYLWEDGLVRFASKKYETDNADDHLSHLTNFALLKSDVSQDESQIVNLHGNIGCKWSVKALYELLEKNRVNVHLLKSRINDVVIKSMIAAENHIVDRMMTLRTPINGCFELYGLDIMIDRHFNPRLLEVNLFPSLGGYTHLDVSIKSALIADTLNLACIPTQKTPVYQPESKEAKKSALKCLLDYSDLKAHRRHWKPSSKPLTAAQLVENPLDLKFLTYLYNELMTTHKFEMIYPCSDSRFNKYYKKFFTNGLRLNDELQQKFLALTDEQKLELLQEASALLSQASKS